MAPPGPGGGGRDPPAHRAAPRGPGPRAAPGGPGRGAGKAGRKRAAGMPAGLAAVAAAHARILARRRTAVALLALLPLAIYGALYRHSPNAVTVGGVASAFSSGGAA